MKIYHKNEYPKKDSFFQGQSKRVIGVNKWNVIDVYIYNFRLGKWFIIGDDMNRTVATFV